MLEIAIHPEVYKTSHIDGLRMALESIWIKNRQPGRDLFYIISGFANYNGGVRFYDIFREHTSRKGKILAYFGGSSSQRLTSRQVVEELLKCGVDVRIVNRKRLMHLKCYGVAGASNSLIISSGNFTGPGMSQNIEMSVLIKEQSLESTGFSWNQLIHNFEQQNWDVYSPDLSKLEEPAWKLLYDESDRTISVDDSIENSLILVLGHADTARINAAQGSNEGKGTQYFWLSKDCFDFFPPLLIQNQRGLKSTYSCQVKLNYVDLQEEDVTRVTFEAENNLDFRLGTGRLRYTKIASKGDIAVISRINKEEYEVRIFSQRHSFFPDVYQYAINFIGHQGKKYGYISNQLLANILDVAIGNIMPQHTQSNSG